MIALHNRPVAKPATNKAMPRKRNPPQLIQPQRSLKFTCRHLHILCPLQPSQELALEHLSEQNPIVLQRPGRTSKKRPADKSIDLGDNTHQCNSNYQLKAHFINLRLNMIIKFHTLFINDIHIDGNIKFQPFPNFVAILLYVFNPLDQIGSYICP